MVEYPARDKAEAGGGGWHGGSEVQREVSKTGGIPPLTPSDGVP